MGDRVICYRHTVDPCLDLYFTTGKLLTRCYSENVLELLHSLPGMYVHTLKYLWFLVTLYWNRYLKK